MSVAVAISVAIPIVAISVMAVFDSVHYNGQAFELVLFNLTKSFFEWCFARVTVSNHNDGAVDLFVQRENIGNQAHGRCVDNDDIEASFELLL